MAELDKPHQLASGAVTFRWHFCYYPDEIEAKQLGPFFAKDLERAANLLASDGLAALLTALQHYLGGRTEQVEVGPAVDNGEFFIAHTNALLQGR